MPNFDLVFREARILENGADTTADVAVQGGRIVAIRPCVAGTSRIDVACAGRWLLPGAVDMHVHLRDPGLTHKEDIASGTKAAVMGGVTTVCDMPNTLPPTISLATLRAKADRAREVAQCDIRFFVALGKDNIGDIATCIGEPSFAGVKVFLGATTGELLTETGILERAIDALPVLFVFHAEDESVLLRNRGIAGPTPDVTSHHKIRPAQAAVEGARRIAALARPGMRLHVCHLSAADELRVLEETPGLTCEVAPHHLWFTADDAVPAGNLLKVNPPIRVESDRTALRSALADGAIAAVATDHAPHTLAEKSQPYLIAPSGVPGLDTMVPSTLMLVQQGCLSMARAVDALSTAPARILGLADRGLIAEGLRADMYLWNPSSTWTVKKKDLATRCGWSPFENIKLAGRPDGVWILGRRVA